MYTKRSEDEDASQIFVERLEHDIRRLYHEYYKFPQKMIYTEADKDTFNKATHCHICEKPLAADTVRDHGHLTGTFRGTAHNGCNLHYKVPKYFPVIFHDLSGYDSVTCGTSYSYVNRDYFVLREDIVIMCDQVTIEEINYNQNIRRNANFTSSA